MKNISSWLSIVLVLQVVVAGGIMFSQQQSATSEQQHPLLSFATDELDKIVISEADSSVTLKKEAGSWVLPAYQNLPANQTKLTDVLENLNNMKGGWPVATSASSHERFEVDGNKFKKRVQLFNGDKTVGELFIGTSPGYRKSHVRTEGHDEVFAAELSAFEFSVKQADWLNKEMLYTDDISSVEAASYSIKKKGDNWSFVGNEENSEAEVDKSKASDLVSAIQKLHVQDIASEDVKLAETKAEDTLKIAAGNNAFTYEFLSADDKYYVKRSDFEKPFVISKTAYDNIIQKSVSDLAVDTPAPDEEASVAEQVESAS